MWADNYPKFLASVHSVHRLYIDNENVFEEHTLIIIRSLYNSNFLGKGSENDMSL